MAKHSFTVIIKKYDRKEVYDDLRAVYLGNSCLVAKNEKQGAFYLNKKAKIVKGKFHWSAGSVRYPALLPQTSEVRIRVTDWHCAPRLETDMDFYPSSGLKDSDFVSFTDHEVKK